MMRFACRSPRRWSCTRSHRARGLREDIELVLVARVMQGRITDRIPELECQRAGADARDLGVYTYVGVAAAKHLVVPQHRSEEHTSELQSLMRISYAVFCLKKNTKEQKN